MLLAHHNMNYIQRLLFLFVFSLATSLACLAQTNVTKHEVQSGETLYSLGRHYGVTVEAIRKANPQMGEVLMAGQVITIPAAVTGTPVPGAVTTTSEHIQNKVAQVMDSIVSPSKETPDCKQTYTVAKKETVYSISRRFGLTEEELRRANPHIVKNKVKKGETLCIPYSYTELAMRRQQEEMHKQMAELERIKAEEEAKKTRMAATIKVAVILPFNLDSHTKSKEAIKMIDFYEGFLLAIDDLKRQGASTEIYAYEEKNNIDSILALPAMKEVQLIVGPMRVEHISALSRFAKKHNIPLAVPFSTKASITASAPTTFQVNTLNSTLYQNVYQQFTTRYPKAKVVFVNAPDNQEKPDYIVGFKQVLKDLNIEFATAELNELADMKNVMGENEKQHILVLSSSSQEAFEKTKRMLDTTAENQQLNFSLFGYPEWQTFSEKNKQAMRKYGCEFFASFYTNKEASDVKNFNSRFAKWFKRDQYKAWPLYGLLGYDVAHFFVTGIRQLGPEFIEQPSNVKINTLQNPMLFQRANKDNGFINMHVSIVKM